MRGEIILENGDRHAFYLVSEEERKLELRVQKMNKHLREEGISENWNMAKELRSIITIFLRGMPYPEKEETPGAATPGESK